MLAFLMRSAVTFPADPHRALSSCEQEALWCYRYHTSWDTGSRLCLVISHGLGVGGMVGMVTHWKMYPPSKEGTAAQLEICILGEISQILNVDWKTHCIGQTKHSFGNICLWATSLELVACGLKLAIKILWLLDQPWCSNSVKERSKDNSLFWKVCVCKC